MILRITTVRTFKYWPQGVYRNSRLAPKIAELSVKQNIYVRRSMLTVRKVRGTHKTFISCPSSSPPTNQIPQRMPWFVNDLPRMPSKQIRAYSSALLSKKCHNLGETRTHAVSPHFLLDSFLHTAPQQYTANHSHQNKTIKIVVQLPPPDQHQPPPKVSRS